MGARYDRNMLRTSAALACLASLLAGQTPQFAPSLLPGLPYPLATDVAFDDLDGDGDLDLFVVSAFGGALLRNDGGGFVDVTGTLPPLAGNPRTAAFVQADADGRPDLLLTWTGQARLFRNLPGGGWQEISANLPAGLPTVHGAVAADVDGDGDQDLVCAGHLLDGGQNQLLTNDGSGIFTRSTPFAGTAFQPLVADGDGDGDLDVFFVRGMLALFRNDGGGAFTDVTTAALPAGLGSPSAMALGDVDGDGDDDVFVGGGSLGDQILVNDGT
ncbi:MAG: VCBS repeat-containing protein, partial [Planctomycetes bacterium]|nr:VCBS repeat-containing protein [Planctomycetota bacterium]